MKRWLLVLGLILGNLLMQCQAADPPLTTLQSIVSLTNQQADRRLAVSFEATVTYFRSYEKTLFVQDGEAAMYVGATTSLDLAAGDRVLIRGFTQGSFRPIVISSDVFLLRHGKPPVPVRAAYQQMTRSQLDGRYGIVRGMVRAANLSLSSGQTVTQLELQASGGIVGVTIDSPDPAPLEGLLDDEVEVTGVISGRFDGKMQMTGLLIHCMSFRDVKILRRTAADPWFLPLTPMDQVLNASDVEDRSAHVRVQGTLTYYLQTSMAVLQDGDRSIQVETPQYDQLRIGDCVEAIGIPLVHNDFLTLKLGEVHSIGPADPISPPSLTWDQIASGKHAFNLVSLEGTIISQNREYSEDVYVISSDNHLFSAAVRHPFLREWNVPLPLPPMPRIPEGSRVRITGVAKLDNGNAFNGAMAFEILLRRPGDITVIAPPPFLNVHNLLLLAGILIAFVLMVVARGWTLERRMRRETARAAMRERSRGAILEDINRGRPLDGIIQKIIDLVAYRLNAATSWCELENGSVIGAKPDPSQELRLQVLQQSIPSHTSGSVGTLFAAIDAASLDLSAKNRDRATEVLFNGAQLSALAIETNGLYTDLLHRSEFDLLTDVHNRFSLERQLEHLIEGERREDSTFGLVYVDLNDFKSVNDQYGHHIGDLYLQQAAARMKSQLRPADMLARLGGDEFAVLTTMVRSREDLALIAARLERSFDEPFILESFSIRGSASVGIALYPEDGASKDSLLNAADAAMYVSKNLRHTTLESTAL